MLTLDLLRYRIEGDEVRPVYLTVSGGRKWLDAADRIVAIFKECVGKTVGDLEARLEDAFASAPDFKVYRGLAKVMGDYMETAPPSDLDAEELRRRVFVLASERAPLVRTPDLLFQKTASQALAEVAGELGLTPERLAASLYSDLRENQIVRNVDRTVTAEQLIERYNTQLAQAMLFRATRMIADVFDNYRQVLTHIKLARVMHAIQPHEGGYRISIDGPLSLFVNVERYGIAMAHVLPALLKCQRWRMAAKVNVGGEEKLFRLSPRNGLKSHYRDEPKFDSSPEEAFFNKFSRNKKCKWRIEREGSVLDLKETVLIPDFKFTHEDGRVAHLEIVGFWTPEYLEKKLDKLSRVREANVIVAVPDSLACSRDRFTGKVIRYKARLLIKDVLPALEEIAA